MKTSLKKVLSGTSSKKNSSSFFGPSNIQPKLTIGAPNDKYEREADAMADKIMTMPNNDFMAPMPIQRKCSSCAEEERVQTMPLVMRTGNGSMEATPLLSRQLTNFKGKGSQLPAQVNQHMSGAFGTDFSQVRVHTDGTSEQMNQGIQAKAFTHGSDVYFNKGQYNPDSSDGKRLLAHELTHVVQQSASNGGEVQREFDGERAGIGAVIGAAAGGLVGASIGALAGDGIGALIGGGIGLLVGGLTGLLAGGSTGGLTEEPSEKIEECSPELSEVIMNSLPSARAKLDKTLGILRQDPVPQIVRDVLWLNFRSNTDETLQIVKSRLEVVARRFEEMRFVCKHEDSDSTCETSRAYVTNHRNPIYICAEDFEESSDQERLPLIILHEATHLFHEEVDDFGYFESDCQETGTGNESTEAEDNEMSEAERVTIGDPPSQRINNADSYECLVAQLSELPVGESEAETYEQEIDDRVGSLRGEGISIVRADMLFRDPEIPVVDLHADFLSEREEYSFSLENVPPSSGFEYNWILYRGSDLNNPLDLNDNDATTYFHSEIIERLRSDRENVQEGTLRCELTVRPYREAEARQVNVNRSLKFDHSDAPSNSQP